jgi:hypothetical protein
LIIFFCHTKVVQHLKNELPPELPEKLTISIVDKEGRAIKLALQRADVNALNATTSGRDKPSLDFDATTLCRTLRALADRIDQGFVPPPDFVSMIAKYTQ